MKTQRSIRLRLRLLTIAALGLSLLGQLAHSASPADDDNLPETLRRNYVGTIDGPAHEPSYIRGSLGLIRTSYGRASLYVAWRVMHLPVGALARESNRRVGSWLDGQYMPTKNEDEIEAWLKERRTFVSQAPAVAPDYFRQGKLKVEGSREIMVFSGQCGPDAFAFARRTLLDLATDTSLSNADRQMWIAGQDAVFARCTWIPGTVAAPTLPQPAPANAPAKLKALNAYQRAAALFYGDDFAGARREFEAIAAVPDHPMRPWAVLGTLRSILREAVRDAEWDSAVNDAWYGRQLRGAEFNAAVAEPATRRKVRVGTALKNFDTIARAALADRTLAPVHPAITYTARRALLQLAPIVPLNIAMNALDRVTANPYSMGALDLFQKVYPRVAPNRPTGPLGASLRQHEWFDFIVAVQGCTDTPKAKDDTACDSEHAYATARWEQTKDNAWLLATLMTARQPSARHAPAAEAAIAVAADRPEWASLQFYAARVLVAIGRRAEARNAVDALAASPVVHKRDRVLVEALRNSL